MIQPLNTSSFDTDDKWTSTCIRGAAAHGLQKFRIVRGNNDRNYQRTQDIEDYQAVNEALARPGDVTSRSLAFTGSNGDGFRREDERKARADESSPECEEFPHVPKSRLGVAVECSGILPVAKAD